MAKLNFDPTIIVPAGRSTPVPEAWYSVVVTKTEIKETKKKDGNYLELTLTIDEGDFRLKRLIERINLKNTNQQAVEIGQAELSALCYVTGVLSLEDTTDLHNIPFGVYVIQEEVPNIGGKPYIVNKITEYANSDGIAPSDIRVELNNKNNTDKQSAWGGSTNQTNNWSG